jgi:glycosyltransferase involved in cell wall biosynthesis
MSKQPRITIVTTSFNHAPFLERAMCSVLDQGYADLEYIVIDGSSCDGSQRIIQRYDEHLAWWISMNDGGPAEALNRALSFATGDIIGFVNADDLLLPLSLHLIAERFTSVDTPEWIAGPVIEIDHNDDPIAHSSPAQPLSLATYLDTPADPLPIHGSFFRSCVFDTFGHFETMLHHRHGFEFTCRLLEAGVRPTLVNHALVAHRRHAASLSASDPQTARRERKQIAKLYHQRLARHLKSAA